MSTLYVCPNGVVIHVSNQGVYDRLDLELNDNEYPEDKIKKALDLAMSESGKPMKEVVNSLMFTGEFNWRKK